MAKREVDISAFKGAEASLAGRTLTIKGPAGQVSRDYSNPFAKIGIEGGKIVFESGAENRKAKAVLETFVAHANNQLIGASEGFTYRMEVVQSHFPIKVTFTGSTLRIENFIGEKSPRLVAVEKGVNVKVEGKDVFLSGPNLELVSKSAQKIEDATKIRKKDHRTFQDGVYIMEKKIRGVPK
jgi:large subunit ribosomal protein L6